MKRKLISLALALVFALSLVPVLPVTAGAADKVSCTNWWCSDGTDFITSVKLNGQPLLTSMGDLTPGETVSLEGVTIEHFCCSSVTVLPESGSGETFDFTATESPTVATAEITVPDTDFQLRFTVASIGYVITYRTDKGTKIETISYDYDTTVTVKGPEDFSPALEKAGYSFAGWASSYSSTDIEFKPGDTIQAEKKYTRNENDLYARWKENGAHDITIDGGKADKSFAKKDETVTIKADEKENYTFSWWVVESGDVVLSDKESASATFAMGDQDVSIRATYKYTGPFLTEFNVYMTPPVAGEHPKSPWVNSEDYEIESYRWMKITNESSIEMKAEDIFEEGSGILYQCVAVLKAKTAPVGEKESLTGYVNEDTKTIDGIEVMISRLGLDRARVVGSFNCALAPTPYTVTFDANGGVIKGTSDPSIDLQTKPDGTIEKMPTPEREGFSFEGWFSAKEGGEKSSTDTVFDADTTVYAQWKEIPVTPPDEPEPPQQTNPFTDVKEGDYFYDAVLWAYYADPQITNGMTDTTFGPDLTVTRGQCVTFLWRAMGEPEPTITKNPFADVPASQYYYKAVLWAVEKGITDGVDDNHFAPNMTLSTAHIITFLYRTLGIGTNGWYEEAAAWAVKEHLMNGTNLMVAPDVNCPRGAVVTFLYRATD